MLVRVPLINGFNTDDKAFLGFLEFFKSINGENVRFELLKYHEYGKDKWEKCGLTYTVTDAFVSKEIQLTFENIMIENGLKVVHT